MNTKRSEFHKQDLQGSKKNQALPNAELDIKSAGEGKQKQHSDCDGACQINWKPSTVSR